MVSLVLFLLSLMGVSHGFVQLSNNRLQHLNCPAAPTTRGRLSYPDSVHWMARSQDSSTTASSSDDNDDDYSFQNPFFMFNQRSESSRKDISTVADASTASSSLSPSRLSMMALYSVKETLDPLTKTVDNATGGWALGYADLSPENETTPIGVSFLATNIAYASVGFILSMQGDLLLGTLLEIVSIASFAYHYTQLMDPSGRLPSGTVKTAILIDYIFALSSIGLGLIYLIIDQQIPSIDAIVSGILAFTCLGACWTWEYGLPYIILHGLWHLFSAYTGYLIGTEHITNHIV